jgi:hypothetical protein
MNNTRTKTWNIGEYAIGGRIKVTVTKEEPDRSLVIVQALDWDSKRVVKADWVETDNEIWAGDLSDTLNDMTSSYYADQILNWIEKQINELQCAYY